MAMDGGSRSVGRCGAPLVLAAMLLSHAGGLRAQQLTGEVRDAATGQPIGEALVRSDSSGAVALTDAGGWFQLRPAVRGTQTFTLQAPGYETTVVSVSVPSEPILVEMRPGPIELEGLTARVESFAARFERTEADLDRRVASLPGDVRIAGPDRIRPYDDGHSRDPWRFMSDIMRVQPILNEDRVRVWGAQARGSTSVMKPEVYVDDRRVWLLDLVLTPLSEFCRVEFYTPMPGDLTAPEVQVPVQLRAYTCAFLADVAYGYERLRPHINYGDLIAGPGGG